MLPRTGTRQRLEMYIKIRRYKQTEIGLHQMPADHVKQQSTGIFPLKVLSSEMDQAESRLIR